MLAPRHLAMTLADLPSWSCRALGRINEMDRQGTASVYTQARAVSGLPPMIREQGLRRWNTLFAVRASAICISCGLSLYEHNAAWRKHGRSCHHSRPETAAAIAKTTLEAGWVLAVAAGKMCSFTLSAMSRQGKDRLLCSATLGNLHQRKNFHIHHGITAKF